MMCTPATSGARAGARRRRPRSRCPPAWPRALEAAPSARTSRRRPRCRGCGRACSCSIRVLRGGVTPTIIGARSVTPGRDDRREPLGEALDVVDDVRLEAVRASVELALEALERCRRAGWRRSRSGSRWATLSSSPAASCPAFIFATSAEQPDRVEVGARLRQALVGTDLERVAGEREDRRARRAPRRRAGRPGARAGCGRASSPA